MQRKIYGLMTLACCLCLWACRTNPDESQKHVEIAHSTEFQGDATDSCFDLQLEIWMEKFNQFQQGGDDMFTADAKAREAATNAYLNCQSRKHDVLANDEARKE
jgi:hypothetical protein